jgi:hypothetical protein
LLFQTGQLVYRYVLVDCDPLIQQCQKSDNVTRVELCMDTCILSGSAEVGGCTSVCCFTTICFCYQMQHGNRMNSYC